MLSVEGYSTRERLRKGHLPSCCRERGYLAQFRRAEDRGVDPYLIPIMVLYPSPINTINRSERQTAAYAVWEKASAA